MLGMRSTARSFTSPVAILVPMKIPTRFEPSVPNGVRRKASTTLLQAPSVRPNYPVNNKAFDDGMLLNGDSIPNVYTQPIKAVVLHGGRIVASRNRKIRLQCGELQAWDYNNP